MALSVESDVELKSPADKFFKRLSSELHHLPNASDIIHGVEVHDGDFKTHGSVKSWSYSIDGRKEIFKEKFEIDEGNMTVSMVALGGHILEQYKSYKIVYNVFPNEGDKLVVLKIKLVYEKFKETDPDPNNYLRFLVSVFKDLDNYLQ
ncbi:MLP-like protein 329 [Punica granatum]|uniref:Bet v I/Major latex protein domain-containing protein n=2 Tax=Punica granatum TaxID=22663 RepID=A0A218XEY0_PUNGR|nr:MLP-like protein 329 [Punica granatum]OWM83507.1 hypothetical protein CDL15_Pgr012988 [Punica granatum]PKI64752.1 hypothetical protein CRG98_014884 [Punica granatum]